MSRVTIEIESESEQGSKIGALPNPLFDIFHQSIHTTPTSNSEQPAPKPTKKDPEHSIIIVEDSPEAVKPRRGRPKGKIVRHEEDYHPDSESECLPEETLNRKKHSLRMRQLQIISKEAFLKPQGENDTPLVKMDAPFLPQTKQERWTKQEGRIKSSPWRNSKEEATPRPKVLKIEKRPKTRPVHKKKTGGLLFKGGIMVKSAPIGPIKTLYCN